jgi:hypothetical protein
MAKTLRAAIAWFGILFCVAPASHGQYLGIGFGRQLSQTLEEGTVRSHFSNGGIFALDVGTRIFPFVSAGLHYSSSRTDFDINRGDAFGSTAEGELSAHTFTMDFRARTPSVYSFRLFGLAGAGLTRFGLDVDNEVETPFPGGAPDTIHSFVFTYGGGIEKHLRQLVHLRLEVRDYATPISDDLFRPGGGWHRVTILGGITIGR